jgi:hypothetical protein
MGMQVFKKSPAFIEHKDTLSWSQEPFAGPHCEQFESYLYPIYQLIIILPIVVKSPKWSSCF